MADDRKTELIREIDLNRSRSRAARRNLVEKLRVGPRIKANLKQNRGIWIAGAILLGIALTKLPPRTKKVVVPRGSAKEHREAKEAGKVGIALAALKFGFDIARPFLMTWMKKRAEKQTAYS